MRSIAILLFCCIYFSCQQHHYPNPHVLIRTNMGDIEAELFPAKAPVSVGAFLKYVDSGYYKNGAFYRVVLEEGLSAAGNIGLIQGGIWQTNDQKFPSIPGIEHESTRKTGLSHTSGTLSLARTKPGTANTEFFICIGDQTQFDAGHEIGGDTLGFAAFGKVFSGMEIVRKIQEQKSHDQHFEQNITITDIERVNE